MYVFMYILYLSQIKAGPIHNAWARINTGLSTLKVNKHLAI